MAEVLLEIVKSVFGNPLVFQQGYYNARAAARKYVPHHFFAPALSHLMFFPPKLKKRKSR
ncbi:MAG: hypothetical protein E7422_08135 [Ruminococcaceae bacterium]|nr:hypothetical protein [Oscillospiraceae bacterium]